MKNLNGKNGKIERLAGKLLATDRVGDEELERIVSAPYLFSSVRARIDSEKAGSRPEHRNTAAAGMAFWLETAFAATIAISAAAGFYIFRGHGNELNIASVPPTVAREVVEPVDEPATPEAAKAEAPKATPVGHRRERPAALKPVKPRIANKQKPVVVENEPVEFYALASFGNTPEAVSGGRIVRVDLPKTSLLSLGLNVPLDNGMATVKTDLLVGADGVPRAIRLVE